ncbi:hypothetical protein F6Y02_08020 (plasmid) [Bacillus megaterium]|nr:hypothetical protein [Priestia megaterium]
MNAPKVKILGEVSRETKGKLKEVVAALIITRKDFSIRLLKSSNKSIFLTQNIYQKFTKVIITIKIVHYQ